jgi:iron complex transport system substrate-binding protein
VKPAAPLLVLLVLSACAGPGGHAPEDSSPTRIASQTILSDEVLWALGPATRARVVTVSTLADDRRYSGAAGVWPPEIPRRAMTSEGILSLSPDLAIIASFTSPEVRALLQGHGVRLLELSGFAGFADYRAHVRTIAAAVGATADGERVVAEFDARIAALAAGRPSGRLSAVSWGDGHAAAAATTFDDVAATAGLSNMAAEKGLIGHVAVPLEQLVAWDPAVLVVSCPATLPDDPACRAAERDAAALPGVTATRAAQTGRIVAIPARELASTGEGMVTAAAILQARLRGAEAPP